MQPLDFSKDKWGRLLKAPEGYWAFVPHPLPPDVAPDWVLTARLSESDRALSELAGHDDAGRARAALRGAGLWNGSPSMTSRPSSAISRRDPIRSARAEVNSKS